MKKYRQEYPNTFTKSTFSYNTLFLDIETTGFNRTSTYLTIIGLAWREQDNLIIEQWFNDQGRQEEPLLLIELERFLKEHDSLPDLIHYNGTTFDLPYLKAKYEQYHLPTSLPHCSALDLYHLAKKYKNLLSLDGIKQKHLEQCFGLFREDTLSGQELIETYLEGIRNQDQRLLEAYLLHNKEDMEGMVFLQNLIKLDDTLEGSYQITQWEESSDNSFLSITLSGDFILSKPICLSYEQIHITLESGSIQIQVPIIHMEARYFHENYKDYYYLPAEDCAMHKSVAEYVEKDYRIKATKETCYSKKTAHFLPLPLSAASRLRKKTEKECCCLNLFYQCYGDRIAWVLKDFTDSNHQIIYIRQLLKAIL